MPQTCRNQLVWQPAPPSGAENPATLLRHHLQSASASDQGKSKLKLLDLAAKSLPRVRDIYSLAFLRWSDALTQELPGTVTRSVQTHGRMVVGLGIESILETGIRLHSTYGVPLLPGTSLKGLASAYCAQVWGEKDAEFRAIIEDTADGKPIRRPGRYFDILFGGTAGRGYLQFHDGWIDPDSLSSALALDVLTPHHKDYYGAGAKPPSDFDDPTPVHFLSVRGKFLIAVTGEGPVHEWAQRAMDLLMEALENWGVGGKTSSGYGRLA